MGFFSPDIKDIQSFQERGKYLMVWRLTWIFLVLFFILGCLVITSTFVAGLMYFGVSLIAVFTLFYVQKTRKTKPVFILYAVSGTILNHTSLLFINDTIHYPEFLWIVSTIIFAFITIGKKAGWIFLFINALGLGVFIFTSMNDHITIIAPQNYQNKIVLITELIFALIVFGYLMNQYLIFEEYNRIQLKRLNNDLEIRNEEINAQNNKNIILMKEIHHRVKNNLQIIVSLLRMQRLKMESDPKINGSAEFNDAINRILAMSLIHQKLYGQEDTAFIDITEYIRELTEGILNANINSNIALNLESNIEKLDMKTVVTFGLLLNELLSNSIKHAFTNESTGEIKISLNKINDHEIHFEYQDSGKWIENNNKGFGTELIQILTEQLEGDCKRTGSSYTFTLKAEEVR